MRARLNEAGAAGRAVRVCAAAPGSGALTRCLPELPMDLSNRVIVHRLGRIAYAQAWRRMQAFTRERGASTFDEIWLLEHPPVYTIGFKGKQREFRSAKGIPLVHSDRGGDITYHGPGQALAYVLMDLQRRAWTVRQLVAGLEQAVIDFLAEHDIRGARRAGAPGVYVAEKKLAALGLRVRQGRSYHGLALNVAMDLTPFQAIDVCGYPGLEVTCLADLGVSLSLEQAQQGLLRQLMRNLGYDAAPAWIEQTAAQQY